jgi:hypothetical protein
MHRPSHLAVDWVDARWDRRGAALITYLTTDPQVLGILAWASSAITLLGFGIAIWQIRKAKRAADAARDAALGMAQRVRSRELLAKLGDARTYLEAAGNHVARGDREIAILCLELSNGFVIEAQAISRRLSRDVNELQLLGVLLGDLSERVTAMAEPLPEQPDFVQLRLQIREASELLRQNMAQSRYTYSPDEE